MFLKAIAEFFGIYEKKKVVETTKPVEPPKCGCGRSSTGNCVGLHKLTEEQWASDSRNPNKVIPTVEAPVEAKTEAPVETSAEVKKPKKPRAKKADAAK